MGIIGNAISKGIAAATRNSTIKAVSKAAIDVINAKSSNTNTSQNVVHVASDCNTTDTSKNTTTSEKDNKYICPSRSSEEYLNANALDVCYELFGVGFTKIMLKPRKKLNERSVKKYGKIRSITISGKNEFSERKRFLPTAYIIIEYLDFKPGISPDIYSNVEYINPGIMSNDRVNNDGETKETHSINSSAYSSKKFCPYCGESLTTSEAAFCPSCGNRLT